jgi:hypothetical protein
MGHIFLLDSGYMVGSTATVMRGWCLKLFNMAAESGMDTCPSPEISDSRKRPLDTDAENGTTKRSHYGASKQMVL